MECSVLNTCGVLNSKVAKSSSREKLWKSWAEVEWRFWNSWSCYYYKADIILVYRGFTKIPKPVVSQRSQSKARTEALPIEPHPSLEWKYPLHRAEERLWSCLWQISTTQTRTLQSLQNPDEFVYCNSLYLQVLWVRCQSRSAKDYIICKVWNHILHLLKSN